MKSEILIKMGMGWPISSDKWKAPLETSLKAMVVRMQALPGILGRRNLHEDTRTSPKPLLLLAFNANDQNAFKHACVTYTHVYHV